MKILIWLHTSKKNKQGKYPIYIRITINGERAEISSGIYIAKKDFDVKNKRVKRSEPLAKHYNKQIEQLKHKLNRYYYDEIMRSGIPTAADVKDLFQKKNNSKEKTRLAEIVKEYINEKHKVDKNDYVYNRNLLFLERIKEVLQHQNKTNIRIDDCNVYFFEQTAYYLRNEKRYSAIYIRKILQLIKSSIKYAFERGYTTKPPVNYTVPFRDETEIIYLTERELDKIRKHRFAEPHLQRIADCFLVQCYTGLAYVDLKKLSANDITIERDGLWLNLNRQKTGSKTLVPVLKNVKELLYKYNFKLPVVSNQRYNSGLKEIAREVGIHKRLTSHVGRKTFGTLLLNKDVPIETVSKLLGHSTVSMTQKHYATVLHMKVAKDLRLLNFS